MLAKNLIKAILLLLFCLLVTKANAVPDGTGNDVLPGNIGVGTTVSPAGDLHIFDSADPNLILDTGGTDWYIAIDDSAGDPFHIGTGQTVASNVLFTVTSSLDVGIGETAPDFELEVAATGASEGAQIGSAFIGNHTDSTVARISNVDVYSTAGAAAITQEADGDTRLNSASGQPFVFAINNVEEMRLTSGGDLAIGRTTADGKIHIAGEMYMAQVAAGSNESSIKRNNTTGKVQKDIAELFPSKNGYLGEGTVAAIKKNGYVKKAKMNDITLGPTAYHPAILLEGSQLKMNMAREDIMIEGKSPVGFLGVVPVEMGEDISIGSVLVVGKEGKAVQWKPGMSPKGYIGLAVDKNEEENWAIALTGHQGYQIIISKQQKEINKAKEEQQSILKEIEALELLLNL